jgi:hypothetical protein
VNRLQEKEAASKKLASIHTAMLQELEQNARIMKTRQSEIVTYGTQLQL